MGQMLKNSRGGDDGAESQCTRVLSPEDPAIRKKQSITKPRAGPAWHICRALSGNPKSKDKWYGERPWSGGELGFLGV